MTKDSISSNSQTTAVQVGKLNFKKRDIPLR